MFETLMSKTFAILSLQLLITFICAVLTIMYTKQLYQSGSANITASTNEKGELDLAIEWLFIKPYFYGLLVLNIIVFLVLLFKGQNDMYVGIPLFSFWSILNGIEIALALLSVDENLGAKVLGITASVTVICALIGMYSGLNLLFLGKFLLIALIILVIANIIRLFITIDGLKNRIISIAGVIIFTLYLLYDFNKLKLTEENTWSAAMSISIDIYLDIINLFLYILDLLSD